MKLFFCKKTNRLLKLHFIIYLTGVLLLDEMKLTSTLTFNRSKLKTDGFTDLGSYTPKHQTNKKGDHALVFMFQPFRGKWVQTLGCFLSKGSATDTVLHQLIMECIILSERAGLIIDAVFVTEPRGIEICGKSLEYLKNV